MLEDAKGAFGGISAGDNGFEQSQMLFVFNAGSCGKQTVVHFAVSICRKHGTSAAGTENDVMTVAKSGKIRLSCGAGGFYDDTGQRQNGDDAFHNFRGNRRKSRCVGSGLAKRRMKKRYAGNRCGFKEGDVEAVCTERPCGLKPGRS